MKSSVECLRASKELCGPFCGWVRTSGICLRAGWANGLVGFVGGLNEDQWGCLRASNGVWGLKRGLVEDEWGLFEG